MTKIKKLFKILLATCLFFVAGMFLAKGAFAAPRLYFDPATTSQKINTDFQVQVKIDVGSTSIFGADAIVNYPDGDLTVKSVTYGNFFTDTINPIQSSGQIILRGSFFSATTSSGSGNGTFATITFNSNKNSGSGKVSFDCSTSSSTSDIIDDQGNNILSCSSLTDATITYTGDSGSSSTAPTNACNGTCGSHYNCNAGLFCSTDGYCRNPDCPSESSCNCPAPTPTPKTTSGSSSSSSTSTSRATPKPTATVLTLVKATPFPTPGEVATASPEAVQQAPGINLKAIGIWVAIAVAGIIVIIIAATALKKGGPPKINPPSGPGFTEPTSPPPGGTPPV